MLNFCYHENNLNGKINGNYKGKRESIRNFKESVYDQYRNRQLEITQIDESAIREKIELLHNYYNEFDSFNENNGNFMTAQSKARPTILEEFCGFLFKDLPILEELNLEFFNSNIYSGLTIRGSREIIIKTKNVDFCIGKNIDYEFSIPGIVDGLSGKIIIPLVAIECKTYLDKTMFSEAQYTAQKIKQGSPDASVYVLAHTNAVAESEIPYKGETPINQVFMIKNRDTGEFSSEATYEFFKEVELSLEKFKENSEINSTGKLLRE